MAAKWAFRRWRNTNGVGDMLDALEWPSLEACWVQFSLTFFYKIHSGAVCLEKDKAAVRIAQKLLFFSHHVYLKHQKSNLIKE